VSELLSLLAPDPILLIVGVAADLAIGDPVYSWHPVRLIGRILSWLERLLRAAGLDAYGGGILLFFGLAAISLSVLGAGFAAASAAGAGPGWLLHVLVLSSLLALGDLVRHVWRIETAVRHGDVSQARQAVSLLVGRDTDRMDGAACRRAAVESLSENLTDGFVSPLFWYVLGGLPALVLFKVVSTMDSMVGYKTPKYARFGWCGARLDDAMNYVPARMAWLLIALVAAAFPACSGRKAWSIGLRQHALLLGPNSGWSEAATAGALQRRIVGPIWLNGALVTDRWLGADTDPPLQTATDVGRALVLVVSSGLVATVIGGLVLSRWTWETLFSVVALGFHAGSHVS
jgi:adenosylcobinamide-phosphate synthase